MRTLICALIVAMPAIGLAAPAEIPDSPAGKALVAWLAAMRSGDDDKARKHFEENFNDEFKAAVSLEQYLGVLGQVRGMLEGVEPAQIEVRSEHDLSAFAKGSGDMWLEILLAVEPEPPHKISGLLVRPGEPTEVSEKVQKKWTSLAELLERVRKRSGFPAVAAAWVQEGKIVDRAVVGVRDSKTADGAKPDDRFHLGSIGKSITATMIGGLLEAGKLDWDTTLAQALPDFEMRPEYRSVTIEDLMQHRGGIPETLTFEDDEMARFVGLPGTSTEQRAAFLREILMREPAVAPRTATKYSNAGFALAGYVAERVAGESWARLVQRLVYDPLELASAGFGWPATAERPAEPRGHYRDEDGLRPQGLDEYPLGEFIDPAGDVHSSISDLARYAAFHVAGLRGKDGALRAATVARLHTPPDGGDYSGGWVLEKTKDGERFHWHNGSAGTFYAMVALFPDSDEAIVVAVNSGDAEPAARRIVQAVRSR